MSFLKKSISLFLLFSVLVAKVQSLSGGPPTCKHKHPEGHGEINDSQSFKNFNSLPATFKASSLGNGLYKVEISGGFIKGYLVRETNKAGSWVGGANPMVDVRAECVTHNSEFSGRAGSDTNLAFMYQSPNAGHVPSFEAIAVKEFNTWWHSIQFAPGTSMSFGG